jgi:23S rRNA (pseudouridine1915-N3)-methyltransferase
VRLQIIAVGARQPAWVDAAVEEYLKRIRAPWRCELHIIEAATRTATRSADAARDNEGKRVLAAVKDRERLILLDEIGKSFGTLDFAHRLERLSREAPDHALLLGGPDGHAPAVRARAIESWSLSPLTLPHGLARVMLVEQLYRAQSVLLGHPYHRQ